MDLKNYKYRFPEAKRRRGVLFLNAAVYIFILPVLLFDLLRRRCRGADKMKRILIVRNDGIGDFILSLPALRLLRTAFKDSYLCALVPPWQKELALASNVFNKVIVYGDEKGGYLFFSHEFKGMFFEMLRKILVLRKMSFDAAIDMRGDLRNRIVIFLSGIPRRIGFDIGGMEYLLTQEVHYKKGVHEVRHFSSLVASCCGDTRLEDEGPYISAGPSDEDFVKRFLVDNAILPKEMPLVVVHPVSRWPAKEWPKERFSILCDRIIGELKAGVVVVGAPEELSSLKDVISRMRGKAVPFMGTLLQLAALLRKADLFIGNDTAPMHMSALLGTTTVALFGPTDPVIFGPYGEGHVVVGPLVLCRCRSKKSCSYPGDSCMESIAVERVFGVVQKYIGRKAAVAQGGSW